MSAIKFGKPELISGYREDGRSWLIFKDGEDIGEMRSVLGNAGTVLYPRWVVEEYEVTLWGFEQDLEEPVCTTPAAAKRRLKEKIAALLG